MTAQQQPTSVRTLVELSFSKEIIKLSLTLRTYFIWWQKTRMLSQIQKWTTNNFYRYIASHTSFTPFEFYFDNLIFFFSMAFCQLFRSIASNRHIVCLQLCSHDAIRMFSLILSKKICHFLMNILECCTTKTIYGIQFAVIIYKFCGLNCWQNNSIFDNIAEEGK